MSFDKSKDLNNKMPSPKRFESLDYIFSFGSNSEATKMVQNWLTYQF